MIEYPPECPLFEIMDSDGRYVKRGAIVEGVEPMVGAYREDRSFQADWGIGMRVLDERDMKIAEPDNGRRSPTEGWFGIVCRPVHVKPLTPAAEEMLAIARAQS